MTLLFLPAQGNPGNAEVPYFGTYGDFIKSAPLFHRPRFEVGNVSYLEKKSDAEESTWLNCKFKKYLYSIYIVLI